MAAKGGKVDVLRNQWDKIFGEIQRTATRKDEEAGNSFCG